MSVKYDVVATVGQYEKDGQVECLSRKVGVIVKHQRLQAEARCLLQPGRLPQRSDDGGVWLALFEPKKDQPQQQQSAPRQAQANDSFDDDIPF